MVQINNEARELSIKVVYYGPALSGKTTNLQALYQKISPEVRGRLMTLDTKDDRTLFFDMMPVFFKSEAGVKVKLRLYTVPGQVIHESTRRIVLQGSDAVVFVADSRRSEAAATLAYWNNMLKNLEANGLDYRTLPIVVQLNKRDLPDAQREEDLGELRKVIRPPMVPAVAVRGEGVVETLWALLTLTYRSLDRSMGLADRWKVSEKEFLERIFDQRRPPRHAAAGRGRAAMITRPLLPPAAAAARATCSTCAPSARSASRSPSSTASASRSSTRPATSWWT